MAAFNDIDTFAELQEALTISKNNGQEDTLNLTGNITLESNLPLIEEDIGLTINGGGYQVSGNDVNRLFFVKSGTVVFDNLTFANGQARGGDGSGGGAGMGGALFIYDGSVTVSNATFSNNQAIGGNYGYRFGIGGGMGLGFSNPNLGSPGENGSPSETPSLVTPGGPGTIGGNGGDGGDGGFGGNGGNGGFGGGFGGGGGNGGFSGA